MATYTRGTTTSIPAYTTAPGYAQQQANIAKRKSAAELRNQMILRDRQLARQTAALQAKMPTEVSSGARDEYTPKMLIRGNIGGGANPNQYAELPIQNQNQALANQLAFQGKNSGVCPTCGQPLPGGGTATGRVGEWRTQQR